MKPPKHILVPTDMSTYSLSALQYAEEVARLFGASVTVLHVIDKTEHGKHAVERMHKQDVEAEHNARAAVSRLLMDNDLVPQSIRIVVRHGSAAREILRAAQELQADLIVMSTHGRTGLRHVLVGSVTDKVVRQALCPVLTIKPEEFHEVIGLTEEEVADSLRIVGWQDDE
ncbi:MAG: universal stress protein [Ignavibacteriales bacterium]|nr:universal stress protein [Ignavibacteriales bacterium]